MSFFPIGGAPWGRPPNPQKRGFWAILCVISSMGPARRAQPESGGPDLIPGEGWKCQKGPFFGSFLDPFWAIFGTPIWRYWPRSHRPSSVYGPKGAKKGQKRGPKRDPILGHFGTLFGPFLGPFGPNTELGLWLCGQYLQIGVPNMAQIWPKYGPKRAKNGPFWHFLNGPYCSVAGNA